MPPRRSAAAKLSPVSSSASSSPDSFVTATASPSTLANNGVSTDISTPGEAEGEATYRNARQLPQELKQHCQIYLEENLHTIALNLLNSTLASDGAATGHASKEQPASRGVYCPPPNQIALLTTIIIHPDFTTRPREASWPSVATDSLVYLRNVLETVGPINARFKDAFRFGKGSRLSRGESPDSLSGDDLNMREDGGGDGWAEGLQLSGKYAKESVWRRGQDFFSVVGWAFNCSVLYPNRWEHWRSWLDLMLDVLDKDLHERYRLDCEANELAGREEDDCEFPLLQESILAGFITQRNHRNGGLKHIIKAIFADGGKASSTVFQELWQKEHKGKSKKVLNKRKREAVDFEKGNFGEWLDDESIYSSQASEPPTPQKRRATDPNGGPGRPDFDALEPAYVESIALRQRLFSVLSFLCANLPDPPLELPDLYESFYDTIKLLPLPLFTAFVAVTNSTLRTDSQISILQDLLELYMPSSAAKPAKVHPERYAANGTSPKLLERCFLPNAANTFAVEDNAKVGLLLEELVMLVWAVGTERFSPGFGRAVREGIDARAAKTKNRKSAVGRGRGRGGGSGARGDAEDDEAQVALQWSNKRLKLLAKLIEVESDESSSEDTGTDSDDEDDEMISRGKDTSAVSFVTARGS